MGLFAGIGLVLSYAINNRFAGSNFVEDLKIGGQKIIYKWQQLFSDITSKIGCALIFGVLAGLFVKFEFAQSWAIAGYITLITSILMRLWRAPGWGKYFSASSGLYKPEEEEVKWIDWVGDKLITKTDFESNRLRGGIQMGLRGWYTGQFLFYALGLFNYFYLSNSLTSSIAVAALSLGMLVQGFFYWAAYYTPRFRVIETSEKLTGGWIAALLIAAFTIMFNV